MMGSMTKTRQAFSSTRMNRRRKALRYERRFGGVTHRSLGGSVL